MENFLIGDTVYHKSDGSFAMIVVKLNDDGTIRCRWFESKKISKNGKELKEFDFISEELTHDTENTSGGFII